MQANRICRQGARQTTLADYSATNVRRAVTVNLVRSSLLDRLPHPADHTVFLFGGVDVSCFEKDDGPRAWYGNDTLRVYSLEEVHWDAGKLALDAPADDQAPMPADAAMKRVYLDPSRVKVFRLARAKLQPLSPDAIAARRG